MGFQSKDADLLGEMYRNCDEIARLSSSARSLALQLEAVRQRKAELKERNEEISYRLRPDNDLNVTAVDFRNRLRFRVHRQTAA